MLLFELNILESVLPYTMKGPNSATFQYSNGRTMIVKMQTGRKGDGNYEVSFYPADREGKDMYAADNAGGDELSIFQTVVDFVEKWYETNKNDVNSIYAEPSINDKYTGKRHRLYTTMANRMAKKFGGTVQTDGQFVNWFSPKDTASDGKLAEFASHLQQILTDESFWDELLDEGSLTRDEGEYSFEFDDANLGGRIMRVELDNSNPHFKDFTVSVDSDKYFDYANDNHIPEFNAQLNKELVEASHMVK